MGGIDDLELGETVAVENGTLGHRPFQWLV